MRYAFVVTSTGLWQRLTNNLHMDCHDLQTLWGVPDPRVRLGSGLKYRKSLCQIQVPAFLVKSLIGILGLKVLMLAGSQLGLHLPVPLTLGWKATIRWWCFLMCYHLHLYQNHFHLLCRSVTLPKFFISGKALLPIGLCWIWLKVTIFSIGTTSHYSVISKSLTLRLLWFMIPLSRRL